MNLGNPHYPAGTEYPCRSLQFVVTSNFGMVMLRYSGSGSWSDVGSFRCSSSNSGSGSINRCGGRFSGGRSGCDSIVLVVVSVAVVAAMVVADVDVVAMLAVALVTAVAAVAVLAVVAAVTVIAAVGCVCCILLSSSPSRSSSSSS